MAAMPALAAKPAAHTMTKSDLPANFAVGNGKPPLALNVVVKDGQVVSAAPADAATANVTAAGDIENGQATLAITHSLAVTLKFDLYISADGERFVYASSCAITPGIAGFELWQQPVRAFALGNPRIVADGKMPCN